VGAQRDLDGRHRPGAPHRGADAVSADAHRRHERGGGAAGRPCRGRRLLLRPPEGVLLRRRAVVRPVVARRHRARGAPHGDALGARLAQPAAGPRQQPRPTRR
jgi:hypothetical protein